MCLLLKGGEEPMGPEECNAINGVKETREIRFREMAKHVSALESSGKEESNDVFDTRPRTTGS